MWSLFSILHGPKYMGNSRKKKNHKNLPKKKTQDDMGFSSICIF